MVEEIGILGEPAAQPHLLTTVSHASNRIPTQTVVGDSSSHWQRLESLVQPAGKMWIL